MKLTADDSAGTFPTSTFKLKAAFTVSAGGGARSPEASPGSPVLPMLDSKWSMLGAGCRSSVSTGVCVDRETFYWALPDAKRTQLTRASPRLLGRIYKTAESLLHELRGQTCKARLQNSWFLLKMKTFHRLTRCWGHTWRSEGF